MTSTTISNEAALAILNDFAWHHRRELIPLTRHIPPETACRAYVRAVPLKDRAIRIDAVLDTKIRSGRARIADEYINHLKRRKFIEVSGRGLEKQIRLIRRIYLDHTGKLVGDLMRCPCCEGKPQLIDVFRFDAREFRAECENCHITISGNHKDTVVKTWNTRPTLNEPDSLDTTDNPEIEQLQKANGTLALQCATLDAALTEAENSCTNRTRERDEALAVIRQLTQQNFSIVVQ